MTPKLAFPPIDERSRELWMQHAAGYIVFRDMKNYAIGNIPKNVDEQTKKQIINGIDDAIYGLMMMMDGVVGTLENDEFMIRIETNILLEKKGQMIQTINTLNGDGMCMGFHDWKKNDFGEDNVVI